MEQIKYLAVILNYNTAQDAIDAAESVIENAVGKDFKVYIADGGSTKEDLEILRSYKNSLVEIDLLNANSGYAVGNNMAVQHALQKYNPDYLVIMNPDIILTGTGLIDSVINKVEEQPGAIGGQPLICNVGDKRKINTQTQIRRIGEYKDVLIRNSVLLKRILKKRFNWAQYGELKPYHGVIKYEVPSGAFFIIRTKEFCNVEMFDNRTFLYGEEEMLGYKIKSNGGFFLLDCSQVVEHYQGKSTGAHNGRISKFTIKCSKDSTKIYLQNYLKCSALKISFAMTYISVCYWLKNIIAGFKR